MLRYFPSETGTYVVNSIMALSLTFASFNSLGNNVGIISVATIGATGRSIGKGLPKLDA